MAFDAAPLTPAGFLWFARHDLRLAGRRVRAFFGKAPPATPMYRP